MLLNSSWDASWHGFSRRSWAQLLEFLLARVRACVCVCVFLTHTPGSGQVCDSSPPPRLLASPAGQHIHVLWKTPEYPAVDGTPKEVGGHPPAL